MKYSVESVVKGLTELNYVFTSSNQQSDGEYSLSDVEWNYNDVPHLGEVHELAEAVQCVVEDNHTTSILIQKLGPFRFPIIVNIYSLSATENFYFTAFGPFVLLVKTSWTTENNRTIVVTRYFLGSSKFLKLSHKLIHLVVARNYRFLMEADLPMRERRGYLRSRKYSFVGDLKGNSFLDSLNLFREGVIPPSDQSPVYWQSNINAIALGTTLVGTDDNCGFRLVRIANILEIFPRICMHAGASLDYAKLKDGCVLCPWHGKSIAPILKVDLTKDLEVHESNGVKVKLSYPNVFISGLYKN